MTQNAINNSASSMDIDNITIDGNTISSTDTNGNIILDPDGTGLVTVGDASSSNYISQLRSSSGQWINCNDSTDSFGLYNNSGTPESSVTANIGSICTDTANGTLYVKTTDSANTGWKEVRGLVQQKRTQTQTFTRYTGTFPDLTTIPQSTEGNEVFTVSITPKSSSHILVIEAFVTFGCSGASTPTIALFQDSTADALAATFNQATTGNTGQQISLSYTMTAGTTSSTTFKIRIGNPGGSVNLDVNGFNNAQAFGGVTTSYLEVTEYDE